MVSDSGHKFSGEEVLLTGRFRLHAPDKLGDQGWLSVFAWAQARCSMAVKMFLKFMKRHWMYLITDNVDFWKPYLPVCAEAIRNR